MSLCPRRQARSLPLAVSHSLMLPSQLPEASVRESGKKTSAATPLV
jgi:hypothetical protein